MVASIHNRIESRSASPAASVDPTDRRAQGYRSTLRSITPTRARRPFDASVDPTEARKLS
jgi:hypothetical protein